MKIILISHSNLSVGMKETAEFIMGKNNDLIAIPAYTNQEEKFEDTVLDLLNKNDKKELIIFITDILGGSVTQKLMNLTASASNALIISGMNLPLVLELSTKQNLLMNQESLHVIEQSIADSKDSIKIVELSKLEEDSF